MREDPEVLDLLGRIAAALEHREMPAPKEVPKAGEPVTAPPAGSGGPATGTPSRTVPEPAGLANAGNVHIEPNKGKLSFFGGLAIGLQRLSNTMADYGFQPAGLGTATSWAKLLSRFSGDKHIHGEAMTAKGIRATSAEDVASLLRSIEVNTRGMGKEQATPDAKWKGDDFKDAVNDLKTSIDDLKRSIDKLAADRPQPPSPGRPPGGGPANAPKSTSFAGGRPASSGGESGGGGNSAGVMATVGRAFLAAGS